MALYNLIGIIASMLGSAAVYSTVPRALPVCGTTANHQATILVLPADISPSQVAAGLSPQRQRGLCLATPERLATAAWGRRAGAIVYLRGAAELPALPQKVISYRPIPGKSRAIAVAGPERLRFYGQFLARSPAPLVVLTDRNLPTIHHRATVIPWQQLDLAALCASGRQILALIAPIRIQQLAHRLGQPPADGRMPKPCRSNWYFTSAARTQTTLGAVMKAVTKRQLRAYLLDAIGYYRKQPRLIAALGLRGLSETPRPQQSVQIRSLYYVFKALEEAQRQGNAQHQGRMQKAYVFRILPKGLVLDRTIR